MIDEFIEHEDNQNSGDTVFRDMTMLALAGFIVIVMLLLPWLNVESKTETTTEIPGSVIVELFWDNERDVDVDLWVKAPEDGAVGYSNMGGLYFNLLRDDRGSELDRTPINYEISYTRGINFGEYQINVHLYKNDESRSPVPVTVAVSVVEPEQRSRSELFQKKVILKKQNQEITVARFMLAENGNLLPGTLHNLKKSLIGKIR